MITAVTNEKASEFSVPRGRLKRYHHCYERNGARASDETTRGNDAMDVNAPNTVPFMTRYNCKHLRCATVDADEHDQVPVEATHTRRCPEQPVGSTREFEPT